MQCGKEGVGREGPDVDRRDCDLTQHLSAAEHFSPSRLHKGPGQFRGDFLEGLGLCRAFVTLV